VETLAEEIEEALKTETIEDIRLNLCDRCNNVWAKAKVYKGEASLYFCGSHFRKFAPELVGKGFSTIDPLDELNFGPREDRLQGDHNS